MKNSKKLLDKVVEDSIYEILITKAEKYGYWSREVRLFMDSSKNVASELGANDKTVANVHNRYLAMVRDSKDAYETQSTIDLKIEILDTVANLQQLNEALISTYNKRAKQK